MPIPREQLRLSPEDLDELLRTARTLHAATVSSEGAPHVSPLWFVWHDGAVWLNSLRKSRRGRDVRAGSQVALCVDAGEEYGQLRGAVLYGTPEAADGDDRLAAVQELFSAKYWSGAAVPTVRSHVWLRVEPARTVSWDFRRIPQGGDRRLEALRGEG